MITQAIENIINSATKTRCAEMWHALNRWRWPDELGEPEERRHGENHLRSELMVKLHSRIGKIPGLPNA